MPKEIGWWKKRHDTRNRDTYKRLIRAYGFEGYGRYVRLVDRMRELDDGVYKLNIDDTEVFDELLEDLRISAEDFNKFIEDCVEKYQIFRQHDGHLWCPELCSDMAAHDEVKAKLREGARRTNDSRWSSTGSRSLGDVIKNGERYNKDR